MIYWKTHMTFYRRACLMLLIATLIPFALSAKSFAYAPYPQSFVTYNGNGATSGVAPEASQFGLGTVTLSGPGSLAKAGYTFLNWNTEADGTGISYNAGATVKFDFSCTLYAQWDALVNPITPKVAPFDRNTTASGYLDVMTTLTESAATVLSVTNGASTLNSGTDYMQSGDLITIKKEYLAAQPIGTTVLSIALSSGSVATFRVSVTNSYLPKDILSASFSAAEVPNQSPQTPYTISNTVFSFVPYGTDMTHLTPILSISPNTVVTPGGAQDFSHGPVTYTVTSTIDGTTKDWEFYVQEEPKAFVTGSFTEASSNDGTVDGIVTVELKNATLADPMDTDYIHNGKIVVTNVPAGLTAVATKTANSTISMRLTGQAISNEAADSISNLHVQFNETFDDGLLNEFWLYSLTNREFDLSVQFADAPKYTLTYNSNTGGTAPVGGLYRNGQTVTAAGVGDLVNPGYWFTGWNTAANGTGTNVPAGGTFPMGTADITLYAQWTDDKEILNGALDTHEVPNQSPQMPYTTPGGELFFFVPYGTDVTHLNPILTLTPHGEVVSPIGPQDFSHGPVTYRIKSTVDNTMKDWQLIVQEEPKALYSMNGFTESRANDGSIDGAITVTLANDTFNSNDANGTDYIANQKVVVTNVPAGLTAVATKTSNTTVMIRLIGTAVSHAESDSIANLHVKLQDRPEDELLNYFWDYSLTNREYDLRINFANMPKFVVTYDGNGNTGGTVPPDNGPYTSGDHVTVSGNTGNLIRTGFAFKGWNTSSDGTGTEHAAGSTFDMGAADVMLYAKWTANVVNDGGGGGGGGGAPATVPSKVVANDGNLVLPVGREGQVSLGNTVKIDIPSNATDQELKLTVNPVLDTLGLIAHNEELLSSVYEFLKNFAGEFNHPVTLTFAFDPSKLREGQRAAIFYYDEANKVWVEVGGIVNGNQISAEVDHFTKFAVLAVDIQPASTTKLSDIAGHWAEASILQSVSDGWINGYTDGTFKPNRMITRAEFAVLLVQALKLTGEDETAATTFTDNADIPMWARRAVAIATQAGLFHGDDTGAFHPDAYITRSEMAVILANALGSPDPQTDSTGFADDASIPLWARSAVASAREHGLLFGKNANNFDPNGNLTRAEAVTVLSRLLKHNQR